VNRELEFCSSTAVQHKKLILCNVDIKYANHDDKISYDDYLEFCKKWITRCFEWLKNDGRFCLNIPLDINKGGQQSVGADLTTIAKNIGFKYHSTIVWNEGNILRRLLGVRG
jgi:site-specific DNA-methyltransferase (adenine-specific)